MSDSKRRMTWQQRFLEEHARVHSGTCYLCGRPNSANSIDHVPPQACFPDGYAPHSFVSPACKGCNEGTKKQDQIFGLYSFLLDFDESKVRQNETLKKIQKLRQGIANNYPDALPDVTRSYPVNKVGSIITPEPVAFTLPVPSVLKDAVEMIGKKLTHALYLREASKILTRDHYFYISSYQPQLGGTDKLNSFLTSTLPNLTVGQRPNIKEYGDRFKYISGYKPLEDFFAFAAQFGHGIILWGLVCGPGTAKPDDGPLRSARWLRGACGSGAPS